MILGKTKFNISKQSVNPWWQLKNAKEFLPEIFSIFERLLTQTQLIKIHDSLDSSRPYERLLENPLRKDSQKMAEKLKFMIL